MPATIRDVAERAGVGLGTVSRVLNNNPNVSPATRERVQQVIDELGFTPSATARRLSTGKTQVIVIVVPFFTRPSAVERLRAIEVGLAESGYALQVYNVETAEHRARVFRQITQPNHADAAFIVSLTPTTDEILCLKATPMQVVLLDCQHPDLTSIYEDSFAGGRLATHHLLDLGHRRIAFVGDTFEQPLGFSSSRKRYQGYLQAYTDAGLTPDPDLCMLGPHGIEPARQLTHDLLNHPNPPTAIFAASDTQALGVRAAALELGYTIPDHLSLIGYDDVEIARHLGLTTVRQGLYHSGERAVALMNSRLAAPTAPPTHEILPVELIVRATTSPLVASKKTPTAKK